VPRRIWLDITGVRPGSDAAMYALSLYAALERVGEHVVTCLRTPGVKRLSPEALHARLILAPVELTPSTPFRPMRGWAPPFDPVDGNDWPTAHDVLLMLAFSGDLSRFAATGTRLVLLANNITVIARPDWCGRRDVEAAERWLRHTAPKTATAIAHSKAAAEALRSVGFADPVVIGSAADAATPSPEPAHHRPFIFACGEISEAGQTRNLLPVWRRLLDTMPPEMVPDLLIAGPVGAYAADILTQLTNSQLLDGRARVVLYPSPAQLAAFARDCSFAIAMGATGWGRGTHNAQFFGAPCLSAFSSYGAVPFDPTNAASIAARVRAWLVDPAVKPPMIARNWNDVARDLLAVLPQ